MLQYDLCVAISCGTKTTPATYSKKSFLLQHQKQGSSPIDNSMD